MPPWKDAMARGCFLCKRGFPLLPQTPPTHYGTQRLGPVQAALPDLDRASAWCLRLRAGCGLGGTQ